MNNDDRIVFLLVLTNKTSLPFLFFSSLFLAQSKCVRQGKSGKEIQFPGHKYK